MRSDPDCACFCGSCVDGESSKTKKWRDHSSFFALGDIIFRAAATLVSVDPAESSKHRGSFTETLGFCFISSRKNLVCCVQQLMLQQYLIVAELRYLFDLAASRSLPLSCNCLPGGDRLRPLRPPPHCLIGIRVRYYSSKQKQYLHNNKRGCRRRTRTAHTLAQLLRSC